MGEIKIFEKNDLIKLCKSCPIFKKYWRFNLWSKECVEYNQPKYCSFYLSRYTFNFRRTHNQTTGCSDQAPAMNWELAVSWDRGVWVSVSDIGSGWPTGIETQTKGQNQPKKSERI